jgi:hypothetical protein
MHWNVREEYHMPRLPGQLLAQDGAVVVRDVEFDIQLSPGVRPGWAATFALPLPSGFDPNSLPQTLPFTIQLQDGRTGAVVLSGVRPAPRPGTWNFRCVGREPLQ